MAIHSVSPSSSSSSSPSPSPTASSSPTLSSPSTTTTTPASHRSPSTMATATLHGHHSLGHHDPSSVKGINILNGKSAPGYSNGVGHEGNGSFVSGPFGISDYFSSSVPKSLNNSVHIGSLSSGLGGLSLASQGFNNPSGLSSGLYSYTGQSNGLSNGHGTPSSSANGSQEEISTIFVVGFPPDMQEREFQNMFVFTPGFEAATLKIPHKDPQEDDALTQGLNGVNPRKQIIGFAKFRSHQEALQAKEVLSGRRVDAEKGSLLKAEMAKKNLHTRRGLSNELVATPGLSGIPGSASVPPAPIGTSSGSYPVNITATKSAHPLLQHRNSLANTAAYDAFHSVPCSPALPSDLLSPSDYPSSYDFYADVYAPNNLTGLGLAETFGGRHQASMQQQQQQQQQTDQLSSSFLGRQGAFDLNRVDPLSMGSIGNNAGGLVGSVAGSFPNSISNSFSNNRLSGFAPGSQRFNKGFLDMDQDLPSASVGYLSKSIPVHTERGFNSALFNSDDMGNTRFQGLPINTATAASLASPSLPSPGMASPGFRTPINPGDQNPPCNTLYVGNLPMNTSEDELRTLFSRCVGYRRLCFRTKSNGPMCFVEFENVECATQALNDLYGNPLSNSVKGGIRLSFSKNPLGVRNSTVNQPSGLGNQLHSLNGTPFMDRRDSMSAMFDQHY